MDDPHATIAEVSDDESIAAPQGERTAALAQLARSVSRSSHHVLEPPSGCEDGDPGRLIVENDYPATPGNSDAANGPELIIRITFDTTEARHPFRWPVAAMPLGPRRLHP